MNLIAFMGYKGSGKTTVAEMVREHLKPLTSSHINFADALKEEVARMYNCSVQYINGHKDNFRLILQGHGTDYRRKLYDDQYWIKLYMRKCLNCESDVIVTSDVRFKNEFELIHQMGGVVVRVVRGENKDRHESETALDGFSADYEIDNRGSLEETKQQVIKLMEKLK